MYCVANMPGCVPRTSTIGIANAALPYTVDLVKHGWQVRGGAGAGAAAAAAAYSRDEAHGCMLSGCFCLR